MIFIFSLSSAVHQLTQQHPIQIKLRKLSSWIMIVWGKSSTIYQWQNNYLFFYDHSILILTLIINLSGRYSFGWQNVQRSAAIGWRISPGQFPNERTWQKWNYLLRKYND